VGVVRCCHYYHLLRESRTRVSLPARPVTVLQRPQLYRSLFFLTCFA
jgi:hypothetical protein